MSWIRRLICYFRRHVPDNNWRCMRCGEQREMCAWCKKRPAEAYVHHGDYEDRINVCWQCCGVPA